MDNNIKPTNYSVRDTNASTNLQIMQLLDYVMQNQDDKDSINQFQVEFSRRYLPNCPNKTDTIPVLSTLADRMPESASIIEGLFYSLEPSHQAKKEIVRFLVVQVIYSKSEEHIKECLKLASRLDPIITIETLEKHLSTYPDFNKSVKALVESTLNTLVREQNKDKPGCFLGWLMPAWVKWKN